MSQLTSQEKHLRELKIALRFLNNRVNSGDIPLRRSSFIKGDIVFFDDAYHSIGRYVIKEKSREVRKKDGIWHFLVPEESSEENYRNFLNGRPFSIVDPEGVEQLCEPNDFTTDSRINYDEKYELGDKPPVLRNRDLGSFIMEVFDSTAALVCLKPEDINDVHRIMTEVAVNSGVDVTINTMYDESPYIGRPSVRPLVLKYYPSYD